MPRKPPPCQVTIRLSDGRLLASGTPGNMVESGEVSPEERQALCNRMAESYARTVWVEAERTRMARRLAGQAGD